MLALVQLTILKLPARAVFSGKTAGWLHGLDVVPNDPIEVTLPRLARTSRIAGLALTRSDLCEGETVEVHGLRCTSVVRTVADLARRLAFVEAVAVTDMALHSRAVRPDDPHASESAMETRLRLLLIAGGLPRPTAQASLYDETGMFIARTDLYYADQRLAIEYDGAGHISRLAQDNRRRNRLLEAGYRLLRFTAADIYRTPASVTGQVRRALA